MTSTFQTIANDVSTFIGVVAPVIDFADPAAAPIVAAATKILSAAAAAEPTAVALVNQIRSGKPATDAYLQAAIAAADAADDKLNADIAAQLASTPT